MSDGSGSSGNDLRRTDASRHYQMLVTAVDGGVFELDADRHFRSVSESTVEMTGYSRERLLGAHVSLLFDDDDRTNIEGELRRLREDNSDDATTLGVTVRTADGDGIPCELRCSPHPDGPGAVGILREDEERTATAAESRRGSQPPSDLLDNVPGMMYRCRNEPEWPMEFVSDGSRELAGYDPEALERGDVMWGEDVIVEEDRQTVWEAVQAVDEDEETFKITYQIETDDGERRWVEDHGRGVFDDGALVAVEGVITDVTERKTLESELEEVFGRVTDAFYALDEEYRFTHVNERAEELLQRSEAELLGESLWEMFPEAADEDDVRDSFRTAIEDQKPTSYELYFEPLDFWVEAYLYPSETGVSVYFRDVTERKERERQLEESERRYRALVENIPNGAVALVDDDLRYITVGGSPVDGSDDLEGRRVREAISPELADAIEPRYSAALDGESSTFEHEQDGRHSLIRIFPVRDDEGEVFAAMGMSQDITERREYQRKLQESEHQYRTLAENFPNGGVGMYDRDLRYTLVDGTMWDDIEPDAEDLEGKTIWEALPPDTADDVEPIFRGALDGETETVVSTLGGRTYRVWATPLRDANGDIVAGQSTALDITEQVEREEKLEELIDRLEASNERLEQFAYAASHDLQEPLRMVSSYLQLIENRYADELDEDGREFIEFAVDGAERMREMIDGLLAYSRVETEGDPFEPVELNDVLADVRKDLQMKIEETNADITTESLPRVRGDDAQLHQVFQNLLSNAIEYTEVGPPKVHVSARERNDHCVVSVRDEGVGIDPDDTERIFEVFERLHSHEEHSGTGIGLALCQRIVERHGGTIWVDSAPGEGATFSFTLPIAGDTDE